MQESLCREGGRVIPSTVGQLRSAKEKLSYIRARYPDCGVLQKNAQDGIEIAINNAIEEINALRDKLRSRGIALGRLKKKRS